MTLSVGGGQTPMDSECGRDRFGQKMILGWPYFGPAVLKCLCTTEVKKDVTGAQDSWGCEYRCEGMCQTWRLNPRTEELLQEECEEKNPGKQR